MEMTRRFEEHLNRSEASKRESAIKKTSSEEKLQLIKTKF